MDWLIKMAVQISQNTMDVLTDRQTKAQQTLQKATNDLTAATSAKTNAQRQLDDLNAIIADCVVVP